MNNINYRLELDKIISADSELSKKVLLHACCAPCSSTCIEELTKVYELGVLYYNPNITPEGEYTKRLEELKRLVEIFPLTNKATVIDGRYEPKEFFQAVRGFEDYKEGQERCFICYELRLKEAAKVGKNLGYDYFCTTLTLSPLKNASKINEIGYKVEEEIGGIKYLPSDFKKRDGYKRSIELSKEYGLYRQNYCGCIFSKRDS